jgi:hypothetical protein
MEKYLPWIGSGLSLLFGMVLGVIFHAWRQHHIHLAKRRIPRQWPIAVRSIVNSRERRVWRWMVRVFRDHHVLVKMPITRFTLPLHKTQGQHWFELLSGVYCTFTVCSPDGNVLGCVDMLGPKGLSLSNQTLKHTLLTQCGIRYWVVDHHHLPSEADIRTAFLGENAVFRPEREQDAQFNQSRASLQAVVSRQRSTKGSGFSDLEGSSADEPPSFHGPLSSGWQENSFMVPMDSRKARLH